MKRGAWSLIHIVWNPAFLLLKTGYISWDDLNSENIELCKVYKLSKNFWRALYVLCVKNTFGMRTLFIAHLVTSLALPLLVFWILVRSANDRWNHCNILNLFNFVACFFQANIFLTFFFFKNCKHYLFPCRFFASVLISVKQFGSQVRSDVFVGPHLDPNCLQLY